MHIYRYTCISCYSCWNSLSMSWENSRRIWPLFSKIMFPELIPILIPGSVLGFFKIYFLLLFTEIYTPVKHSYISICFLFSGLSYLVLPADLTQTLPVLSAAFLSQSWMQAGLCKANQSHRYHEEKQAIVICTPCTLCIPILSQIKQLSRQ